jgi:site-specific DNA-methyltransferase (adenine-specific)
MKLYSEDKDYKLYEGSMLDLLQVIKPASIDSIVTDPPYELNFMNKGWDNSGVAFKKETWEQCYKALKPGGYLLAFGGSRTFHRIAVAIEDAGFEIRDTIMWLYGSGFPKSMNIGLAIDKKNGVESKIVGYQGSMMDFRDTGKKQKEISGVYKLSFGQIENSERKENPIYKAQNEWSGWGTCLKPAYEPIIVARKPCEGSIVENVLKYGVGGINLDECRVGNETIKGGTMPKMGDGETGVCNFQTVGAERLERESSIGRFPANVILTYDDTDFEEVCGGMPNTKSTFNPEAHHETEIHRASKDFLKFGYKQRICNENNSYNDEGSAARYFYCAKASKKDRDEGLNEFKTLEISDGCKRSNAETSNKFGSGERFGKNTHPTVKPTELMQYLVRLVTPKGGTVLDPFNGSGSTGRAVMFENKERNANYKYVGIELTPEYLPIAKARIEYVINNDFAFYKDENGNTEHKVVDKSKVTLFDYIDQN